jgi:hypothetical protein
MKRISYLYMALGIIALVCISSLFSFGPRRCTFKYIKAKDEATIVTNGLDQYMIIHGVYPEIRDFPSMVNIQSCLVVESLIPKNMPITDPWGQPFSGQSVSGKYHIACAGDPSNLKERPPFFVDSPYSKINDINPENRGKQIF